MGNEDGIKEPNFQQATKTVPVLTSSLAQGKFRASVVSWGVVSIWVGEFGAARGGGGVFPGEGRVVVVTGVLFRSDILIGDGLLDSLAR